VTIQTDSLVGFELGGYRIETVLARGGMGVVYLAEHRRLERTVAVKVLAPELAGDAAFRARFLQESRLAAGLNHPNVIPIHDADEADGVLFIAMRYVEGTDLGELIDREAPLPTTRALAILSQVAGALDAAHARGLVHRDVKPGNVLIAEGDHPYLTDFGLSKRLDDNAARATAAGEFLGTIAYVAPEQIEGRAVDHRADVYSLGCVLYECLVGEPPFPRDSELATMWAHVQEDPPAPSEHRADLPPALDQVIAQALAKDPGDRYASCRDLARAAVAVTVEEASRRLAGAASRAVAGRTDLNAVEAELADDVIELQLVREHARLLAAPAAPGGEAPVVCPFKGLAAFEPADADYFFGRERLVAELVARLVGTSFLAVVGASGSGKSSVLRAGLLPALAGGVLPGSGRWRRLLMRPGEHPLEELRGTFLSAAEDPLAEALEALAPDERLLLAVDQLEELFTSCRSADERVAFVTSLARAARDAHGRAVVVAAVRADFYGRFADYPELAELLAANHVLVGQPDVVELRRAIERPAARAGLHVEPDLVDALVADAAGQPGGLPLLSTALLELWLQRSNRTLSLAAYRESGGIESSVARLAEHAYARLDETEQPVARTILLRLAGEGEGDSIVRRRAPLSELDPDGNETVSRVLGVLTESRLVTVSEGSVEVAHEALLREWPRLRDWIEDDGQGRRLRHHLAEAARTWDAGGRDQDELYRGARLSAALDWTSDHGSELNELERQFVAESHEQSDQETRRIRRTNRRLRVLLAGVAVLLVAAVVGGILAVVQRGDARDAASQARRSAAQARSAELTAEAERLGAQALVEPDLGRALLLARQGIELHSSAVTEGNLLAALVRSPAATRVLRPLPGRLRSVSTSPDGSLIAVSNDRGEAAVIDADSGAIVDRFRADDARFGGDGRVVVVALTSVVFRDPRTGEEQNVWPGLSGAFHYSPDLRTLALVTPLGSAVSFLDTDTLEEVRRVEAGEGRTFLDVRLLADGRGVLTVESTWPRVSGPIRFVLRDLASFRPLQTVTARGITTFPTYAVTADGTRLAVGRFDGSVAIANLQTGTWRELRGRHRGTVLGLGFTPDGRTLVTTGDDGVALVWDSTSGGLVETLAGHGGPVFGPAFTPDGATLYTASSDGSVIAWDLAGDRRLGRPFSAGVGNASPDDQTPDVFGLHAISPDGELVAARQADGIVAVLDSRTFEQVSLVRGAAGLPAPVLDVAWSPDSRWLAVAAPYGQVGLWDPRTGNPGPALGGLAEIFDPESPHDVRTVAFSPNGSLLAAAVYGGSGSGGVYLWNPRSGELLLGGPIPLPPGGGANVNFPRDLAFSPDGTALALTHGGALSAWSVSDRRLLFTVSVDEDSALTPAVAYSPDGHTIATGGGDGAVRFWDAASGAPAGSISASAGWVNTVAFSPDGRTLSAAASDGTVRLIDVRTRAEIGTALPGPVRESASAAFSPGGKSLVVVYGTGDGIAWDVDPAVWRDRACAIAGRSLSETEWQEFLAGRPYEPACGA
jgi:WD40 repeat protein/predicted Ser/Thr protein kinase